jgi:hypothetical protein
MAGRRVHYLILPNIVFLAGVIQIEIEIGIAIGIGTFDCDPDFDPDPLIRSIPKQVNHSKFIQPHEKP